MNDFRVLSVVTSGAGHCLVAWAALYALPQPSTLAGGVEKSIDVQVISEAQFASLKATAPPPTRLKIMPRPKPRDMMTTASVRARPFVSPVRKQRPIPSPFLKPEKRRTKRSARSPQISLSVTPPTPPQVAARPKITAPPSRALPEAAPVTSTPPRASLSFSRRKNNLSSSFPGKSGLSSQDKQALLAFLQSQIRKCWSLPVSFSSLSQKPVVRFTLHKSGEIIGAPELVNVSSEKVFNVVARSGIQAIKRCAPYQPPKRFFAHFDEWKNVQVTLDPARDF